jgi:hypothetical protein
MQNNIEAARFLGKGHTDAKVRQSHSVLDKVSFMSIILQMAFDGIGKKASQDKIKRFVKKLYQLKMDSSPNGTVKKHMTFPLNGAVPLIQDRPLKSEQSPVLVNPSELYRIRVQDRNNVKTVLQVHYESMPSHKT